MTLYSGPIVATRDEIDSIVSISKVMKPDYIVLNMNSPYKIIGIGNGDSYIRTMTGTTIPDMGSKLDFIKLCVNDLKAFLKSGDETITFYRTPFDMYNYSRYMNVLSISNTATIITREDDFQNNQTYKDMMNGPATDGAKQFHIGGNMVMLCKSIVPANKSDKIDAIVLQESNGIKMLKMVIHRPAKIDVQQLIRFI